MLWSFKSSILLKYISAQILKLFISVIYTKGLSKEWHPDYNRYMSEIDKEEEKAYQKRIADRLDGDIK